jgi:formiminoglutamase
MSGASSNAVEWFTRLEPAVVAMPSSRPDDPRLGDVMERWAGQAEALRPGRPVTVGFPQDEGIRRNGGRVGAAKAPDAIRTFLYRLVPYDGERHLDLSANPPLEAGNVRIEGSLEDSQNALADVVGGILHAGAIPVVLGGGHEAAFGHYLGYVKANLPVAIINLDAHLDVRPCIDGLGHSGSPFRQAIEHSTRPLPGTLYRCVGANPFSVSRDHLEFLERHGALITWANSIPHLDQSLQAALAALKCHNCAIYLSIDADVVAAAEVPGVSAPNPGGVSGISVAKCAFEAGKDATIRSFDLVEVNPAHDIDGRSARWAALVLWQFFLGLAKRDQRSLGVCKN